MSERICVSLLSSPIRSSASSFMRQCRSSGAAAATTTTGLGSTNTSTILRISTPSSKRPFSTSPRWRLNPNRMSGKARQRPQKSMSIQQKELTEKFQASGESLNYIGVIEGTFIPPTGNKLPSILSNTRDRWKIEKYRLRSFLNYMLARFMAFWYVKPALKLERGKTPKIAQEIYEEMYKAFAAGNVTSPNVEGKLVPGFVKSLQTRINQRRQGETLQWKLHEYLERPRCVSYVFAMPNVKGSNDQRTGIMQAIVRIRSRQSLVHLKRMRVLDPHGSQQFVVADVPVDRDGQAIPEEKIEEEERKNAKDMTEYLVLQRRLRQGEVGEWQAWGMTTETGLEEIRKQEAATEKRLLGAA
ncbi:hypothetical protein AC578_4448 [Pseudocercospora eumusae]|uniref:Tim44-like domain-containing protein n=1 Tax=Pseudocercospora eumusae TaxID=321146 RepID=A0A139HEY9_9PEZI|nr:hypothetical protein AC578_4448 [Pseudocercospora eumusae]